MTVSYFSCSAVSFGQPTSLPEATSVSNRPSASQMYLSALTQHASNKSCIQSAGSDFKSLLNTSSAPYCPTWAYNSNDTPKNDDTLGAQSNRCRSRQLITTNHNGDSGAVVQPLLGCLCRVQVVQVARSWLDVEFHPLMCRIRCQGRPVLHFPHTAPIKG